MASSATAMPLPNGGAPSSNSVVSSSNAHAPAAAATGRQFKNKSGGKQLDGVAKRNPSQKAWSQGPNTSTQRNYTQIQQNGGANSSAKNTAAKTAATPLKETPTPDKHANDRLIFALGKSIGLSVVVTVKDGSAFEGIFTAATVENSESSFTLKMVKRTKGKRGEPLNAAPDSAARDYIGVGLHHTMVFEAKDIVDLAIPSVPVNGAAQAKPAKSSATTFLTDTDISGNAAVRERTLQRWEPSGDVSIDLSLESNNNSGTNAPWDQFEANERLYGVTSSFDETAYTTTIDRSNPLYKQRAAQADKIAREIIGTAVTNSHMAEERGLIFGEDDGKDEEAKYSEVRRTPKEFPALQSGSTNKYTPPARRAPTGHPTVHGAPVDPAIISSQIARPQKPAQNEGVPNQTKKTHFPINGDKNKTPRTPISPITDTPKSGIKGLPEANQRQPASTTKTAASGNTSPNPQPSAESAVKNVEIDLRDSFKQFANNEKLRVEARRRNQIRLEKDDKLKDLKKFSQSFKLNTPVPTDLVPILAKDTKKQNEIVEKAQRIADEAVNTASAVSVPTSAEQKSQAPGSQAEAGSKITSSQLDRQNNQRLRTTYATPVPYASQVPRIDRGQNAPSATNRQGQGLLSTRLVNLQHQQQQHKVGTGPAETPSPAPILEVRVPPPSHAINTTDLSSASRTSALPTPTSTVSIKFNVKAMEFKPNPSAISFTPTAESTAASSPRSFNNARLASRLPSPSAFFGKRLPLPAAERPSINDAFNPIKRARKDAELAKAKNPKEDYAFNGGILPAHKTNVTWDVPAANREKLYPEMFDRAPYSSQPIAPPHPSESVAHPLQQLPHQHQLPFHLQHGAQGMPPAHAIHQPPHLLHPPHHHPMPSQHHFDDHRMHISSSNSSVLPSPRLHAANMAYQSPMSQHAQLVYGPQGMAPYNMGPGPQAGQYRQFSNGPQYMPQQGPHMGAPMMMQSPSSGPYLGAPQGLGVQFGQQLPMYSPSPAHVYPHHAGPPPAPPGSTGYPSPGRGAPMMMHQGSQQGQHMMMYGMSPGQQHGQPLFSPPQQVAVPPMRAGYPPHQQPHYGTSPHQGHHYPRQHHNGHGNSYHQHHAHPSTHQANHQGPPPIKAALQQPEPGDEPK
ncbi:MAG: hypothetical protein M1829_004345 [Trizodia sp. TS-e1964]|nr:MAG: hypothetical protein M1829_004345 [Trizodia sp. TS-e1964]